MTNPRLVFFNKQLKKGLHIGHQGLLGGQTSSSG